MYRKILILILLTSCTSNKFLHQKFNWVESDSLAIISGDSPEVMQVMWDGFKETDSGTVGISGIDNVETLVFKINFTKKIYLSESGHLYLSGEIRNSESSSSVGGMNVAVFDIYDNLIVGQLSDKNGNFNLVCKVSKIENLIIKFSSPGFTTKIYSVEKLINL